VPHDEGVTEPTILAAGTSPRGDLLLRRRPTATGLVTELVVNGVFAMDSTETSSERALAALVPARARRVLVGGLGLGYTVTAVLTRDDVLAGGPVLDRVDVVELEPLLVQWAQQGLTPVLAEVAADPRVRLHVGDVAAVLSGQMSPAGPWDAVLLDVDNGPDFLIHDANAPLYGEELLGQAYGRLAPGGVLAIWCQGPAPELLATLTTLAAATEHRYEVAREGRSFTYVVYTVTRSSGGSGQSDGSGQNVAHG
jgi:spermidine synthase